MTTGKRPAPRPTPLTPTVHDAITSAVHARNYVGDRRKHRKRSTAARLT